ncbi:Predicted DNA-binding transcriptional regulator YafY, contains an HTH and WYL domains [Rathayibacter oskolensis]|uniref:Predicted DNA-binding transcriptional regulator YafY, contains an HTH and WYL domains n=1 Tax=Rathayibacter oskolensis TaxID=1891671 RepID=A0A1X7NZ53_9MICO|nr:YafY family protein [Rathayibacter oskolensis]SMH43103.1 Predicted DNA-binding transcriptional regulator YafY, contains an HTH and WYL domains [Rathayibacter oskolensis]
MPRTTGRTLALLGLLQTRRDWSGAELRERLEVSGRTLRRDIEDLRGLGYGIDSVPGVGGGYRLGIGASVPPLVLSTEEAVAIAVGLRAAAGTTVTGIEDAAARALVKLEQSLAAETRERIASVERAVLPLGGTAEPVDLDTVVTIARAIRDARSLRIDYTRHDGQEVRRTIQPHRIVHTGSRWYVVARDADRDAWRTLRLDRLTPRLPLAEPFTPQEVPDDAVRDFASRSISVSPYPHRYRVRMHAPAAEVAALFGPAVARVTALDDGTAQLEAGAASPEQFALYIGTTGIDFHVLEGDDLRAVLVAVGERLIRAAALA